MGLFDNFKKILAIDESDFVSEDELGSNEQSDFDDEEDNIELFEKNVISKISNMKQLLSAGKVDLDALNSELKEIENYIDSADYISSNLKLDFKDQINITINSLNKETELQLPDYILDIGRKYYCLSDYIENNLANLETSKYNLESLQSALKSLTNEMQRILYSYSFQSDIELSKNAINEFESIFDNIIASMLDKDSAIGINNKLNEITNQDAEEFLKVRFSNLLSNIGSDSWSFKLKTLSKHLTKLEMLCSSVIELLDKEDMKAPLRNKLYDILCSEQYIITNIWRNRNDRDSLFRTLAYNFEGAFVASDYTQNSEVRQLLKELTTKLTDITKSANIRDINYNKIISEINLAGIKTAIKELNYYFVNNAEKFKTLVNKLNNIGSVNGKFVTSKREYNEINQIWNSIFNKLYKVVEPIYSLKNKVKDNVSDINVTLGSGQSLTAPELVDFLCEFRDFVFKESMSPDLSVNMESQTDAVQSMEVSEKVLNNFKLTYSQLVNFERKIKTYNNIN